ncbi:protein prenylyltransferase [Trametes gibbosa]|nr:protein prenylyltransferase [Trametes gibbosa]
MSAITAKLGQLLAISPVSIEILPGDGSEWFAEGMPAEGFQHAPFLFIEGNLGVPKKIAYQAYLDSVSTFRRCRERLRTTLAAAHGSPSKPDTVSDADVADTLESSSILLLVNPAHQSALNARKRLVQVGMRDAVDELRFVSALLTLHEGAKQSILWHHRRWVLRSLYPVLAPSSCQPGIRSKDASGSRNTNGDGEDPLQGLALDADAFRTEFSAAAQACEIYPRNYHAWGHRYLCAEELAALLRGGGTDAGPGLMTVWEEEEAHIRGWIDRHVSDYSAMQYACRLEDLRRGLPVRESGLETAGRREPRLASRDERACEHAWSLVQVYPSHESLWLYLRGALSLAIQQNARSSRGDADVCKRVVQESRAFAGNILAHGRYADREGVLPGDHTLQRNHATRFLAFQRWKERALILRDIEIRELVAATVSEDDGLVKEALGLSN